MAVFMVFIPDWLRIPTQAQSTPHGARADPHRRPTVWVQLLPKTIYPAVTSASTRKRNTTTSNETGHLR